MIIHAYDRSATNWIVIKTCKGIVKKILLSMLVNQCNEKSGQCLSVLLQLPLERLKTMTIRKSIAHPSQHHLLQVIFYEILIVPLDFCEKNVFNGHLVVSGKSVSILKRQLLWTGRFHWFSFFPLRNTPQLMWIVDSQAKINLSNNNSVPTSPTLTSMLTAKIVLWL